MKALIGFHDDMIARMVAMKFARYSVEVTLASTPAAMLDHARHTQYDFYAMDVNLGTRNGLTIEPAQQCYALVEPLVKSGRAKFVASTGNDALCQIANKNGIFTVEKMDLSGYIDSYFTNHAKK
ncbi:MAG TPA: hypothetical protein VK158_04695 [Acidobacteriota bacterium]|nr:hypothetical protein [Acidobacteriota bacterium]